MERLNNQWDRVNSALSENYEAQYGALLHDFQSESESAAQWREEIRNAAVYSDSRWDSERYACLRACSERDDTRLRLE